MGGMFLDARQQVERGSGAGGVLLCLQAHAHDAVEHEGEEADQGMGPDAIRQAVMDRRDLDVGFQDAEAALDIGKALVAGNSLGGREVESIGQERQLAVEEFSLSYAGIWVMAWFEGRGIVAGVEASQNLTRSNTPMKNDNPSCRFANRKRLLIR